MSELTIKHQWLKPWQDTGDDWPPTEVSVTCGGKVTVFEFPYQEAPAVATYTGSGACLVKAMHPSSGVATESSCEPSVSLEQDVTCNFASVPFDGAVPTMSYAGMGLMVVALLLVAYVALRN